MKKSLSILLCLVTVLAVTLCVFTACNANRIEPVHQDTSLEQNSDNAGLNDTIPEEKTDKADIVIDSEGIDGDDIDSDDIDSDDIDDDNIDDDNIDDDAVMISTPQDLLNMNENKHYVLANDIDLKDYDWQGSDFEGVLDGNGHKIINMHFVGTVDTASSVFGLFTNASGVIRNLTLDNVTVSVTATHIRASVNYGAIAAICNNLTISNCHVTNSSATIKGLNAKEYEEGIGGLIGNAAGHLYIEKSTNSSNISSDEFNTGGIVGKMSPDTSIIDCTNSGDISGKYYVGGIVGNGNGAITDCTNSGAISGYHCIGGISGRGTGTITNCINGGTVYGSEYNVGGISGGGATIIDCTNNGSVSGQYSIGGIVGAGSQSNVTITNCTNNGEISGEYYIGGIVGRMVGPITLTDCTNSSTVSGNESVGQIYGKVHGNITSENCQENGKTEYTNE